MSNNKTQFESKEALVSAMKSALIKLIFETNTPDELLKQFKTELQEVRKSSEVELREKGLIK
jgi:hypothetical protein